MRDMNRLSVLSVYTDEDGNQMETCLDEETGELIDRVAYTSITRDVEYSEPLDIMSITNKVKFNQAVAYKIGKRRYNLWVGGSLLDLAIDRQVHPSELCIFFYLGREVGYNNLVYTSIGDILKGTGCGRTTVYSALQSLKDSGLIREVGIELDKDGDRMFAINPRYFFLGYYPYRQELVKDWYKG